MWYKFAANKIPQHGLEYEFNYAKNPAKSENFGDMFGQDIEPIGNYVIEQYDNHLPVGWLSGKLKLKNPYVIDFGGGYRDSNNWKRVLSERYNGLTGRKLTKALINEGYDGIITVDDSGTQEIIVF
jgi:hypothetical protein